MASADTVSLLYGGETEVAFKDKSHRYYIDGQWLPGRSVTTILDKTLSKGSLMLWAMEMALKHLEDKLPVVTLADLDEARQAHVKRRDKGADTGSIVHALAEQLLKGQSVVWDAQPEEVVKAIDAFSNWYTGSKPEVIAVEQVVYSRTYNYVGTFDSVLKVDGQVCLCDLKTTNASREAPEGVYWSYFVQLGAYAEAYEEQRQYELSHGGTNLSEIEDLLVISCKKNGSFHLKRASDVGLTVEKCRQLWSAVLQLYDAQDTVKKRLGGK